MTHIAATEEKVALQNVLLGIIQLLIAENMNTSFISESPNETADKTDGNKRKTGP